MTTDDLRKIRKAAKEQWLRADHVVPMLTIVNDYLPVLLDALDRESPRFTFEPPEGHYLAWALVEPDVND